MSGLILRLLLIGANGNIGEGYYMFPSGNIPEVRFIFSLGNTAEVFDAELEACLLACQRAKQLVSFHQQISDCWVFLDSTAAIKRLQHLRPGSGQSVAIAIHTLAHELQDLGIQLHIHWVPGHQQVKGNEIADFLAKQGSQLIFNPIHGVVTHAYLRRRIRKQALDEWNQLWIHRKAGRAFKGTPSRLIDKQLAHTSKRESSRVIQIRSGHGYFNSYLSNIPNSGVRSPACHCGNPKQTPEHLVLYCKKFRRQRREFLQELMVRSPDGSWWVDIYSKLGTQQLLMFLKATSICLRPQVAATWISGLGDIE